ncbi:shikimate dehydrogenase [Mycobacteroides abscessus subsp. abscessus]|nr:shikimate dehydrogenase [Mycobacteroides abscessus subsp. abscessus]
MLAEIRRAAVLGLPIGHSRSPDLHVAAYRELGLTGWTYERIECTAEQLPDVVGSAGPEWVGFSVTMPGKFAALRFASTSTERARSIGAANTLVRSGDGWHADNTDVDGVSGALSGAGIDPAGQSAVIVGAGGTARPAIVALAAMGVPWPTTLAAVAQRRGAVVVGGLDMLLNQAFTQVELFTGQSAPRAAMAAALH